MGLKMVYCDFDGTLIHGNIEAMFLKYLIQSKKIGKIQYILAIFTNLINIFFKILSYGNVVKSWTYGRSDFEIQSMICDFIDKNSGSIQVNQTILEFLQQLQGKYEIVVLTGSFEKLVSEFIGRDERFSMISDVIGTKVSPSGFWVLQHPYGKGKCKFIDTSKKTIGIGNEVVDQYFLQLCDIQKVVAEDEKMVQLAKKKNWEMVKSVWT